MARLVRFDTRRVTVGSCEGKPAAFLLPSGADIAKEDVDWSKFWWTLAISEYVEPVGYRGFGIYSLFVIQHLLAFPASGRPGGALANQILQTVKFDIALALQLRSQNISLIAVTISGIWCLTWKIIKGAASII